MATPELKNTQVRTGTNIGDIIEVVVFMDQRQELCDEGIGN